MVQLQSKAEDATSANKGVDLSQRDNFSVSSGSVTIKTGVFQMMNLQVLTQS